MSLLGPLYFCICNIYFNFLILTIKKTLLNFFKHDCFFPRMNENFKSFKSGHCIIRYAFALMSFRSRPTYCLKCNLQENSQTTRDKIIMRSKLKSPHVRAS